MRKGIILFLVSILFLPSCGVPNYRDFKEYISIYDYNSSIEGKSYVRGFRVDISIPESDLVHMESGSPAVLVMYSITPSGGSSLLESRFDRYIRNYNNHYNGSPATFDSSTGRLNNVEASYGENEKDIYLYSFTSDESHPSLSQSPNYTYPDLTLYRSYFFMFRKESVSAESESPFYLIMDVYALDDTGSYISLDSIPMYRFNNDPFFSSVDNIDSSNLTNDYSYYRDLDETDNNRYEINLFISVAVQSANYNNISWSDLEYQSITP